MDNFRSLEPAELEALKIYAKAHGKGWKARLSFDWYFRLRANPRGEAAGRASSPATAA